jgi:hypothetical protein
MTVTIGQFVFQLNLLLYVATTSIFACLPAGKLNTGVEVFGDTYVCLTMSKLNWTASIDGTSTGKYRQFSSVATADKLSQITIENCELKFVNITIIYPIRKV